MDLAAIRSQFPILDTQVHGKPLVYLDNSATMQKPTCVLNDAVDFYRTANANIHRGNHHLSQVATELHENARHTVADFLNAADDREIIFTSGCTMGINLVANILGYSGRLKPGDEIILTTSEHHSNIVPWQMLCQRTGAVLKVVPLNAAQTLDIEAYQRLLSPRTVLVAVAHVSNVTGAINPVADMTAMAKRNNPDTLVLIDGAQSVSHLKVDVQALNCDFYAFSGHKLYAPTGTGALWGRADLLEALPPFFGGGEMIKEVTFAKTTYNDLPFKYEAGTPNFQGDISLARAIKFVNDIGLDNIAAHEAALTRRALADLATVDGLHVIAPDAQRSAVISFLVDGVHHYDLGTLLDQMGIAVRTGHHCCQPLMQALGTTGTTRLSLAVYNTDEEIEVFLAALRKALHMLR